MQTPLQVTFRGMPPSDALEARIREKAAKLDSLHTGITRCRVVVERRDRHKHQGAQFRVNLDLRIPGHEVVVDRDHDEDVYVALRDAFDAGVRQLEDFVRIRRGDVKQHQLSRTGRVARLRPDDGFGFIRTEDGSEFYFSRSNVVDPSFDQLEVGAVVQFIVDVGAEGPQAKRVSAGKHGAPVVPTGE